MEIKNLINILPWHQKRRWSMRDANSIKKIIIHQELSDGTIEEVNGYHIGLDNHISAKGCPHFCYHYGIRGGKEHDGQIIQANELSHITWHTKGQNSI